MTDTEQERRKYWRMWQHKDYGHYSPGDNRADWFRSFIAREKYDTLIDLGCGTGRVGKKFAQKHFKVFQLDLVDARDPGVQFPFIEACLWELPFKAQFDWFYCADVMEHIPPTRVNKVLDNIAGMARKGGCFTISHIKDDFGERINDRLHLTIEPPLWWLRQLEMRWPVIVWDEGTTSAAVVGPPYRN